MQRYWWCIEYILRVGCFLVLLKPCLICAVMVPTHFTMGGGKEAGVSNKRRAKGAL